MRSCLVWLSLHLIILSFKIVLKIEAVVALQLATALLSCKVLHVDHFTSVFAIDCVLIDHVDTW